VLPAIATKCSDVHCTARSYSMATGGSFTRPTVRAEHSCQSGAAVKNE
jgi:hypothetical protein